MQRRFLVPMIAATVSVAAAGALSAKPFSAMNVHSNDASAGTAAASWFPLPLIPESQSEPDAATRSQLIQAREAVWRAYFQGDSAALMRILPAKMVAMDEDRAAIIRSSRDFAKSGGKYVGMTFTQDQFFVNGNTAVIWSNYVARTTDAKGKPQNRSGRAIELFVKTEGRWLNPHWHLDEK